MLFPIVKVLIVSVWHMFRPIGVELDSESDYRETFLRRFRAHSSYHYEET